MDEPDIYDPKHWKWSTFYYNQGDKNWFVPGKEGLGLRPNFAHKSIQFIFGLILIITTVLILYNLDVLKF
ncbi:hypothetical protein [Mucilaginibacter gotjawali]|uniref:Membrane protein n=1 Tax=Mucilaginibacter gotjawali TaxID=1550579 RepID=A0A839SI25_9SPHI|nr:hypothetical protein [Mucilaginibacter gotjawali]MBB3057022.1 putative membrane protein [Mucilaginibacter gotjawali]